MSSVADVARASVTDEIDADGVWTVTSATVLGQQVLSESHWVGPTGPQGEPGVSNIEGPTGPPGPRGATGPQGADSNVPGPAGESIVGPTGPAGQSIVGPTGPAGASGTSGATGPSGPQGLAGPTGPSGPAGQGATGPSGPQGLVGPTGPSGPAGTPGLQGATGPSGPAGAPGATGPTGPAGGSTKVISDLWAPIWPWSGSLTSNAYAIGQLTVTRTVLAQPIKSVMLWNGNVATTTVRLVVYADTPTGPGALVTSVAMTFSSLNTKLTAALAVPAGTYWMGVQNIGAASYNLQTVNAYNPFLPGAEIQPASVASSAFNGWGVAGQGSTVPDPFPMGAVTRNYLVPMIWVQAA